MNVLPDVKPCRKRSNKFAKSNIQRSSNCDSMWRADSMRTNGGWWKRFAKFDCTWQNFEDNRDKADCQDSLLSQRPHHVANMYAMLQKYNGHNDQIAPPVMAQTSSTRTAQLLIVTAFGENWIAGCQNQMLRLRMLTCGFEERLEVHLVQTTA